ncbi:MAG: replicative DNA helicase [Bacteroidales bacterium]|nr:replicative DNA helicase [Bacteroidales bacterium]
MAKRKEYSKASERPDLDKIASDVGHKPPQAIEIEEAVLAAMMLEPEVITDVRDMLYPECFYNTNNRLIYEAIAAISSRNDKVDILTVADELAKAGNLDTIGGRAYLSALSNKISAAAHIDYHTKILLQKSIQRELISISYTIQKHAFEDTETVDELMENAQQAVFSIAERNMRRSTSSIKDLMHNVIDELQKAQERGDGLSGVPSGYSNLDSITLGWQASNLIILAARPATGKTAFVLTMARNMAVDYNVPVAFFSLEMSSNELLKRILISETGLEADKIKGAKKFKNPDDWNTFNDRIVRLLRSPLWIDDTPSLSIYEFRSKARRLVNNAGVKMIVIDYLQLMAGPPELKGMREQEVAAISRSLKSIAKELNVPILALSQLNRSVEIRGGNKRPQLSDLRESGAIEQDADIVLFLHRPEMMGTEETYPGQTQLIIAKHRNGKVADVEMRFLKSQVKFVDANSGLPSDGDEYAVYESGMNQVGVEFDDLQ